jgi:hypothetical protein
VNVHGQQTAYFAFLQKRQDKHQTVDMIISAMQKGVAQRLFH